MMPLNFNHKPVLVEQVLACLAVHPAGLYLDATVGGGGHAAAILAAGAPDAYLVGLDQDQDALAAAAQTLAPYNDRVQLLYSNFANMQNAVAEAGFGAQSFDGVLMDIGVSSHQLDTAERGFSFQQDAPLDMRMDRQTPLTAAIIINTWDEAELTRIFYECGEENWARRIARFIIAEREEAPIQTTGELVEIIKKAIPQGAREKDKHPATRTFQALRITVNDELGVLERGLDSAKELLKPGGRLAVISFHSLEDRIIKEKFRLWARSCICSKQLPVCICNHQPEIRLVTRKPRTADAKELTENPRSRSAKLRAAEKLV